MAEQLLLEMQCVRWRDGVLVLAVSGELDIFTVEQLDRQFLALSGAGHHRVVLDAAGLEFCDASGLSVLIRAQIRARAHGGWLCLAAAVPRVRRLLTITGLTGMLPAFDTVAHALDRGPGSSLTASTPSPGDAGGEVHVQDVGIGQ